MAKSNFNLSDSERRVYNFWKEYKSAPKKEQENISKAQFGHRLERCVSSSVILVNETETNAAQYDSGYKNFI
jgi:hypothetical protein